jgi:hypothetical protein
MMNEQQNEPHRTDKKLSRSKIVFIGFLIFIGYFLLTEHLAHTIVVLPFLLLLACPLMHIFMHGGHGKHGGQNHDKHISDNEKDGA